MTNEEIIGYIDRLNKNEIDETIFLRQISDTVEVARVWEKEPELDDSISTNIPSFRFFFIKDENGKYVGAILDMINDLHWYILEEDRKKGYLTKSLRETIIPFIFYDEYYDRKRQRISIEYGIGEENYNNSKRVAQNLGFKPINEDKTIFELDSEEFDWQYENLEEKNGNLSEDRFEELRKRLILTYRQLIKISDELLMIYENDKGLRDLAKKVGHFNLKLEDIEWENKEKNKNGG